MDVYGGVGRDNGQVLNKLVVWGDSSSHTRSSQPVLLQVNSSLYTDTIAYSSHKNGVVLKSTAEFGIRLYPLTAPSDIYINRYFWNAQWRHLQDHFRDPHLPEDHTRALFKRRNPILILLQIEGGGTYERIPFKGVF